jgi:sugar-specific transcriptional regulator TrmB
VQDDLPTILTLLQGLKGLTKQEAKAFIRMCSKKSVSVKDVMTIFSDLGTNICRSNAYKIVETFTHEHLLFPIDNNSTAKHYKAIHPKTLLEHLKGDHIKLEREIALLAESYETADYEDKDPKDISKILKSESEIHTESHVLHQKKCNLIIIHQDDPRLSMFFSSLESLGRRIKGDVDVILFSTDAQEIKGIIELSKRIDKEGNLRVFGSLLYDPEKYDYYYEKEVKHHR